MRADIGPPPQRHGLQAILWVRGTDGNSLAYVVTHVAPETRLEVRLTLSEGNSELIAQVPYDASAHRWLQVRDDGQTTYFQASPDGATYETIHQLSTPFDLSEAAVGFVGHNWAEMPGDEQVRFDHFEFECGE